MKPLSSAVRATILVLAIAAFGCSKQQDIEITGSIDSVAGVLEITNGYGGKLMILSNPRITTPRRDIVRVDSFYVDPAHPGLSVKSPRYQRLLHWVSSTGTDTVGSDPTLITNSHLGGWEVGLDQPFNPNTQGVVVSEDIATIGVLPPPAAIAKYGKHGRNGVIVMTTKKEEYPDEPASEISDGRAFVADPTRPTPDIVHVRFIVDTTGHVDPHSFVIICRETPGAFLEPAQKEAILRTVWKPARLHSKPVREVKRFDLHTPVDSIHGVGDTPSQCGY